MNMFRSERRRESERERRTLDNIAALTQSFDEPMSQCLLSMKFLVFSFSFVQALNAFPEILTKPSNQTFNISSNAHFTCQIKNLADHHVTWFKLDRSTSVSHPLAVGDELFTSDRRYSVSSFSTSADETFSTLEIHRLTFDDEGTYLCQIANRRQTISVAIHLLIQVPMFISPTLVYVELGDPIQLNCTLSLIRPRTNTSSTNSPLVQWLFHTNKRNKPNDVEIQKQWTEQSFHSLLIIHRAQLSHSGFWTCVHKTQRQTARLIVDKSN